jgi:hypothetical protein
MAIDNFKNQIRLYKEEIAKIKDLVSEKKLLAKKEIEANFRIKFEKELSEFRKKMNKDESVHAKVRKIENEKKKERNALKDLNRKISLLSKRKRKAVKKKLTLIEHEKNKSIEILKKKIKILYKQIKALEAKKFAKKWKRWSKLRIK